MLKSRYHRSGLGEMELSRGSYRKRVSYRWGKSDNGGGATSSDNILEGRDRVICRAQDAN
jgi:hypothetical protein